MGGIWGNQAGHETITCWAMNEALADILNENGWDANANGALLDQLQQDGFLQPCGTAIGEE